MYIVNGIEYQKKENFLKCERKERKALYRKEFLMIPFSDRAKLISYRLKEYFDAKKWVDKYKGTPYASQYKKMTLEAYNRLLEAFPYFSKAF